MSTSREDNVEEDNLGIKLAAIPTYMVQYDCDAGYFYEHKIPITTPNFSVFYADARAPTATTPPNALGMPCDGDSID